MERHIIAAYRVCDGLGRNKIVRVGKNSGPVLSRLWTKVHGILGQCREDPSYIPTKLPVCLSHFVQKIFAINSRSRPKAEKYKSFFAPDILGTTPTILWQIVSAIYRPPLAEFG